MQLALNGKVPTVAELTALIGQPVVELVLGDFDTYEENIQWDYLRFVYANGDVLISAAYTGLWELTCYDKLRTDCQLETTDGVISILMDDLAEAWDNGDQEDLLMEDPDE